MITYARPNAESTGPRWPDPRLRYTGPTTITEDTRISRRAITGPIKVSAGTLTVRDCTWRPGEVRTARAFTTAGTGRLVLEYVDADGGGVTDMLVDGARWTIQWCEVLGFVDGARFVNDNVMRHCWIHGLSRIGSLHPDGGQSIGGTDVDVSWNNIDCRESPDATPTNGLDMGNACIMLGNEKRARYPDSTLDRITITDNWLDGGNYAVNIRPDPGVLDVTVARNTFGGNHRYGPILAPPHVAVEDNVITSPAPIKRTGAVPPVA